MSQAAAGQPVIGIIGAGKVGQVLARLLNRAGYTIGAVYSRTPAHADRLARQVDSVVTLDPRQVLDSVDLTLLTVSDDAIEPLAVSMAGGDFSGRGIVHTSGAHHAGQLAALAGCGAMTGSLHPAYPFVDVEVALNGLAGTTFAVEAEAERLMVWLGDIVRALEGSILRIAGPQKTLYHAALVLASNYTVTLYAAAERLLMTLSENREAVDGALNTLVSATITNLLSQGVPNALTGPLVRGDVTTIEAHIQALQQYDRELAELYQRLARLSFPILAARGVEFEKLKDLMDRI